MANPVEPAPRPAADESAVEVDLAAYEDARRDSRRDWVAAEEPLEIQIGGVPLAVVMRTPGRDEDLVRGLLLSERVIGAAADIVSVRHCTRVSDAEAEDNVVQVRLRPGIGVDLERLRRNLFASASCGVCGKATIENALAAAPALDDPARFDPGLLSWLEPLLRQTQDGFARTGGLHAAAVFSGQGELLVSREDVGRHNAVDKCIGWAVSEDRLPLAGHILMVSGRISFEIVQKSLSARIPLIAAISAPTSLAVRLAEEAGVALAGFLRGRSFNAYGMRERIRA